MVRTCSQCPSFEKITGDRYSESGSWGRCLRFGGRVKGYWRCVRPEIE